MIQLCRHDQRQDGIILSNKDNNIMTRIKVYSTQKSAFPQTVEIYTVENGTKSKSSWCSEINTTDYLNTRDELEQLGYLAHPASSQEITTQEYSIFQQGVN
jgi:hypothetical protein